MSSRARCAFPGGGAAVSTPLRAVERGHLIAACHPRFRSPGGGDSSRRKIRAERGEQPI